MLRKFSVTNYKNFKDSLEIDFSKVGGYKFNQDCISSGYIGKSIIYGRNATGKTNLGEAILNITKLISNRRLIMFNRGDTFVLNADLPESYSIFRYSFQFDEHYIYFEYFLDENQQIIREKFLIDDQVLYFIDYKDNASNEFHLELVNAETILPERYLESQNTSDDKFYEVDFDRISFIRYLLNNAAFPPESIMMRFERFVTGMIGYTISNQRERYFNQNFLKYLNREDHLVKFEKYLNKMGIQCKLILKETIDGNIMLYFDHKKPVPFFDTASSGTISLFDFYRRFILNARKPTFIYMDEFDAFYHYEMAENLVEYFKEEYSDCQIMLTTHNTNLMTNHIMRPDCLFILSQSGKLTALCDATERELREGHNLEKLYIAGEFEQYE